ncbi:MAG: alpha/beta hydrolase [Eubacterium sp.]|nr:alpha/beta hydrolase [Eubacterium sp.]
MFTKNNTFDQIMHTSPVRRAIGNLFPACWLERIPKEHYGYTMSRIEKEDRMDWGAPFISDSFLECANILMDTVRNQRFGFVPLWKGGHPSAAFDPADPPDKRIPDADANCAEGVWLFTANPETDSIAFAHLPAASSVPPYPSAAVSAQKREQTSARPAVILCPGGGYEMLSAYSEGIQLAQRMERDGGYKAFILHYRITPNHYPLPQMDLALAIMHIRAYADWYRIDPDRVLIVGASAGGHLCASEALLQEDLKKEVLAKLRGSNDAQASAVFADCSARPDGIGLLYPVISFLSEYHEGSCQNLIGQTDSLREVLSVERHITNAYPPTYAFSNADDDAVPVSNTIRLKEALAQAGVTHLCEVFASGGHGVGLGYDCSCGAWSEHMLAFFDRLFS